jgi:cell division protein FtsQ
MNAERSVMNVLTRFFLGVAALAGLGTAAWYGYTLAASQPIRSVVFTGDADKIARADLERLAEGLRALPAGGATLAAVREAAKRIPWVRDASARRQFPDAMVVRLEAFDALARWGEGQLVSTRGEVFPAEFDGKLPRFSGPEGASAEMTREYAALAAALAPLGIPIAELKLSARGAWQLALESGLVLELGRGDMAARVARFAAAWPRLPKEEPELKYADLRYPNGFAVRRTKKS